MCFVRSFTPVRPDEVETDAREIRSHHLSEVDRVLVSKLSNDDGFVFFDHYPILLRLHFGEHELLLLVKSTKVGGVQRIPVRRRIRMVRLINTQNLWLVSFDFQKNVAICLDVWGWLVFRPRFQPDRQERELVSHFFEITCLSLSWNQVARRREAHPEGVRRTEDVAGLQMPTLGLLSASKNVVIAIC